MDAGLVEGSPGVLDEVGAAPRVGLGQHHAVGDAGVPDLLRCPYRRHQRLRFVVVGDDRERRRLEDPVEDGVVTERARAVYEYCVEVAETADAAEFVRVELEDYVVAGIDHHPGQVVGVGLRVDVDDQGAAVRRGGVGGQAQSHHRLTDPAFLVHDRDDVGRAVPGRPGIGACAARDGGREAHAVKSDTNRVRSAIRSRMLPPTRNRSCRRGRCRRAGQSSPGFGMGRMTAVPGLALSAHASTHPCLQFLQSRHR